MSAGGLVPVLALLALIVLVIGLLALVVIVLVRRRNLPEAPPRDEQEQLPDAWVEAGKRMKD